MQSSARPICHSHAMTRMGCEPALHAVVIVHDAAAFVSGSNELHRISQSNEII